jgi:Fe-S-cluster containining protein/predicted CoA-binding protein
MAAAACAPDDGIVYQALADSASAAVVAEDFSPGSPADAEARGLLNAGFDVVPVPCTPRQPAWVLPYAPGIAALGAVDIVCLFCPPGSLPAAAAEVLRLPCSPRLVWLRGSGCSGAGAMLSSAGTAVAHGESLAAAFAGLFDGGSPFFSCRRCGKCCEGRGGIVVSPRDLTRLSVFLGMPGQEVLDRCTEPMRGQPVIRCGSDGFCMFFRAGEGCSIHPARPAVCRAWPFFRGNLVDRVSFGMARQDCPGISRGCSHAAFAWEGYRYLREYKLLARDRRTEGAMLIVDEKDLPLTGR